MILDACKTMRQKGKAILTKYQFFLKPTVILASVYLLAISAILRADFYYYDDIERACWGWPDWGFSRYLSNFISGFLHADTYLTDISPFPQILAVFMIALTSVMAVWLITGKKKVSCWELIAAIPIGLSPYFLECLSYKFDAPYMALSVFFCVLPLFFCNGKQLTYLLCTAISMIGMCSTYQAASGIFPMLVILVGLHRWLNGEKTLQVMQFFGISALGYILGMLVFRKFFMTELIAYASTEVASLSQLIPTAITNYKRYIVHFLNGFKVEWVAMVFVICVCFLWTAVTRSKQNKVITFVLVSALMVGLFLLSFGVYPILTTPLFAPRAMYGIGCFIAFLGIYAVSEAPKGYVAKLACLALSWVFFIFSFTYGNALRVQAEYTDFRITEVIDDLMECEQLDAGEEVTLQITGTIGYAPGVESMREDFPMIEKLVPVTFIGDGWWGEFGIRYYYGLPEMKFAETYDPPEGDFTVVADNYLHTIHERENYIWIDLH